MNNPNPQLQLAQSFIEDTNCHVFLTGKAGTGKTTFLQNLRRKIHKRLVVTAPTGVAAINAGGMTLHSFFQLPFGPFIPGGDRTGQKRRFSKDKINIIKSLDLLVIDEISMVRSDLLDAVDDVLQRLRRSSLPFGGVQLLMIGDLYQLAPVVKEPEWDLLHRFYDSAYFFDSLALGRTETVTIELMQIYRQTEPRFIELLNRVRDNRLDPPTLEALNSRFRPDFVPPDGCITLCTHNRTADGINIARLQALAGKTHTFPAQIEGDFPEHSYPTSSLLELKEGAQVMFIKNDPSPDKLYFNGKIGKITRISANVISVSCDSDTHEIEVEPATWENIEYKIDAATSEISQNMIGTFSQFPLKPAWAITIHKSQGLTFDRAVIDAKTAFAPGQVYVALSRCRSFDGLVLGSPLSPKAVGTDAVVRQFLDEASSNPASEDKLQAASIAYQQELLYRCFDFHDLERLIGNFIRLLTGNQGIVRFSGVDDLPEVERLCRQEMTTIGANFRRELAHLFDVGILPETDPAICERTGKAAEYFLDKIDSIVNPLLTRLAVDTDNRELQNRLKRLLTALQQEFAVKRAAVSSCRGGFNARRYQQAVAIAAIDLSPKKSKPSAASIDEADLDHPDLFRILKQWRAQMAAEKGVPAFHIMHQKTLVQLASAMPSSVPALLAVKGIGPRLAKRYGEELLDMIITFRRKNEIEDDPPAAPAPEDLEDRAPPLPKPDTRQVSLELFEEGLSIAEIAGRRGLIQGTIEGHLAQWIEKGRVAIDSVVPKERQQAISEKAAALGSGSLRKIKDEMGDDFSYGEIKMVLAHLRFLESI